MAGTLPGHCAFLSLFQRSYLCLNSNLRGLYVADAYADSQSSSDAHRHAAWCVCNLPSATFRSAAQVLLLSQVNHQTSFIHISIPTSCVLSCLAVEQASTNELAFLQNQENYLLTPSPQGDLCVAKLFPPRRDPPGMKSAGSMSDPGHGGAGSPRVVRCEASRNLKWTITNTGVISPIYKLSLPAPDSADLPLFQISKPNPNAGFWSMFYFAYAGHNIPPKRIEFGKIQKNPPGPNGGGTRITITGKTPEEKAVWQTLGEGNEDCVEWVVLCAALNLLEYVVFLFFINCFYVDIDSISRLTLSVTRFSRRQRRIWAWDLPKVDHRQDLAAVLRQSRSVIQVQPVQTVRRLKVLRGRVLRLVPFVTKVSHNRKVVVRLRLGTQVPRDRMVCQCEDLRLVEIR